MKMRDLHTEVAKTTKTIVDLKNEEVQEHGRKLTFLSKAEKKIKKNMNNRLNKAAQLFFVASIFANIIALSMD